jgi:hypothetical protein
MTTTPPPGVSAEKVIEILRRRLDEANWQVALATAAAETAAERAAQAENRVAELEATQAASQEA